MFCDITEDADILEEIARIYGYDNIPSAALEGNATAGVKTDKQKFIDNVKANSIACGLNEILTYSFVNMSSTSAGESSLWDLSEAFLTVYTTASRILGGRT